MSVMIKSLKPSIGGIVATEKSRILDADIISAIQRALEDRIVLVFPQIGISDEEQLALTDQLGGRINFARDRNVPGTDTTASDVQLVTLDDGLNKEPDYVLGTFFWHIDGITVDIAIPKGTLLSARGLAGKGGATEFANLYAAYEALSDADKEEIEGLSAIHSIEAAVRPVYGHPTNERRDRWRGISEPIEQPLVWTHADGRKSLLLGTHADGIVGLPGAHGRALLRRLEQWAAQPDFVYRHQWQIGDLVIWNNQGSMHRVLPYSGASRVMHRTSLAGTEKPGRMAREDDVRRMLETVS
jgi:alpha-ketoglutarate-dependent taurine dioxygenase